MSDVPFDYRRHFSELIRVFLPVFLLVGAAGIVAAILWLPERSDRWDADKVDSRVGLLKAGSGSVFDPTFALISPIELARAPRAPRFDAPMGSPLGAMTYNAQPFQTARHLGDDLNGIGGWDSDRGDPVYAVAEGEVIYAGWPSDGWGHVAIVLHRLADGRALESFYGHLEKLHVAVGTPVKRGDRLGSVGKADGRYLAHLHFEMRNSITCDPGMGYAGEPLDRFSGEEMLARERGAPANRQNSPLEPSEAARGEEPEFGIKTLKGERETRELRQ